jgi:hypothetical protein
MQNSPAEMEAIQDPTVSYSRRALASNGIVPGDNQSTTDQIEWAVGYALAGIDQNFNGLPRIVAEAASGDVALQYTTWPP